MIKDEWEDYAAECLEKVPDEKHRRELRKVFYAAFMVGLHAGGDIVKRYRSATAQEMFQRFVNEMDAFVADLNEGKI